MDDHRWNVICLDVQTVSSVSVYSQLNIRPFLRALPKIFTIKPSSGVVCVVAKALFVVVRVLCTVVWVLCTVVWVLCAVVWVLCAVVRVLCVWLLRNYLWLLRCCC